MSPAQTSAAICSGVGWWSSNGFAGKRVFGLDLVWRSPPLRYMVADSCGRRRGAEGFFPVSMKIAL